MQLFFTQPWPDTRHSAQTSSVFQTAGRRSKRIPFPYTSLQAAKANRKTPISQTALKKNPLPLPFTIYSSFFIYLLQVQKIRIVQREHIFKALIDCALLFIVLVNESLKLQKAPFLLFPSGEFIHGANHEGHWVDKPIVRFFQHEINIGRYLAEKISEIYIHTISLI